MSAMQMELTVHVYNAQYIYIYKKHTQYGLVVRGGGLVGGGGDSLKTTHD